MKNLNFSFKTAAIVATACLTISFGSFFMQNHFYGKSQKMSTLSNGVGTCFTRVTQTFTALMIQDFSSVYMQPDFMSQTQECFNIANTQFNLLWTKAFKAGYKNINQIVSDLHWYHEKTQKLKKMVTEGGVALTNSNIINKYTGLEAAKNSFTDAVDKELEGAKTWATIWFIVSFVTLALFMVVAAGFGVQLKQRRESFDAIENDVANNEEVTAAKIDRILENVFAKLDMPKTYAVVNNYYSNLLEQKYADFEKDEQLSAVKEESVNEIISSDFHEAMTAVLETMQTKAFTHGIMLDIDLEDDFRVKGEQEALEQFLYNIVNYASENSLHHNEGRRISLKSKPLGGTAYLKVGIANYCFNATELNYLNEIKHTSLDVNMNLILIKELINDIGATIAVKNKTSASHNIEGCEIEIIFERVKAHEVQKDVKVIKGTKKEILRAIQSEV